MYKLTLNCRETLFLTLETLEVVPVHSPLAVTLLKLNKLRSQMLRLHWTPRHRWWLLFYANNSVGLMTHEPGRRPCSHLKFQAGRMIRTAGDIITPVFVVHQKATKIDPLVAWHFATLWVCDKAGISQWELDRAFGCVSSWRALQVKLQMIILHNRELLVELGLRISCWDTSRTWQRFGFRMVLSPVLGAALRMERHATVYCIYEFTHFESFTIAFY